MVKNKRMGRRDWHMGKEEFGSRSLEISPKALKKDDWGQ
jgi:hypothetical protein